MTPPVSSVLRRRRRTYRDGLVAVVLFFVCQLLICGLQQLTARIDDFPAPILAMVLVAALMILASKIVADMDSLYHRHLRGPTDLVNRHMSIGFTVPFTMIMQGPMSSPRNIGLIIAGFIITGILNTVLVFAFSLGLQTTLASVTRTSPATCRQPFDDFPPLDPAPPVIPAVRIDSCNSLGVSAVVAAPKTASTSSAAGHAQDRIQSCLSEATTLTNNPSIRSVDDTESERPPSVCIPRQAEQPERQPPQPAAPPDATPTVRDRLRSLPVTLARRAACFVAAHPVLCTSLLGIPLVGLPVARATGCGTALDTCVLFALWTGTLAAQAAAKCAPPALVRTYPRVHVVLVTALNAVLWTSLGTIAFLAARARSSSSSSSIDVALAQFSTGTSLADLIHPLSSSPASPSSIGAGDIASSILDAGIVSWGLKLFECRAQLLSRAGLTTLAAGAIFAVANIVCGPLLVRAMGLAPPAKALAFAARSVTLALAGPAMTNLGGDVGLNAAMVVFNGVVFQVAMGLGGPWGKALSSRKRWSMGRPSTRFCGQPSSSPFGSFASSDADAGTTVAVGRGHSSRRGSATSDVETLTDGACSLSSASLSSKAKATADIEQGAASSSQKDSPGDTGPISCTVHMRGGDLSSAHNGDGKDDSPVTVAAGMTIGINAAAMGTAYLYEDGSRAAPYAALSMTVFGVMTVVFTSIQPLAGWVVSCVA